LCPGPGFPQHDGEADDLSAIKKAHDHANQHGLPVRSNPDATCHLGTKALTALIATDTDWSTSRFLINDSRGVENSSRPLFEVRRLRKPVRLEVKSLRRGQTRLETRPPVDCLVYVENNKRRIYIRRGLNQNSGTTRKKVFLLRRDGTIEGSIDWDYDSVTTSATFMATRRHPRHSHSASRNESKSHASKPPAASRRGSVTTNLSPMPWRWPLGRDFPPTFHHGVGIGRNGWIQNHSHCTCVPRVMSAPHGRYSDYWSRAQRLGRRLLSGQSRA